MNKLIETGTSYKGVTRQMWKIKELICGPKVGRSEPACINNPVTGELITDKDTIKKVSLEHCAGILKKNEIRECDKVEYMAKEKTHNQVMGEDKGDSYELERDMYYDILECLKKKNKNMFNY